MSLSLATWNINSVRLRLDNVLRHLKEAAPDVLCLQEIKATRDAFPGRPLAEAGYVHQAVNGQPGYHGVAIVSRRPFKKSWAEEFCGKGDARHVAVRFEDGVELHNFYVPSGGDVPDPAANEKFAHKLAFLAEMERHFARMRSRRTAARILVGDLNVAPGENDVWSHRQLLDVVSHTPIEVEHLGRVRESHDWLDVARAVHPPAEKVYTWWSYRAKDWAVSDRGRRLDHIWLSPALAPALVTVSVHRPVRGWVRASDHVPVVARLAY